MGEKTKMGLRKKDDAGKKEKNRLLDNPEIYRLIFESASDGILAIDTKKMSFVFANPQMSKMAGYSEDDFLKLSLKRMHPKESLPYVMQQIMHQIEGKITLARDIPLLRKDKTIFYCDVNSKPLELDGRQLLVGFYRDITDRREAEKELEKTIQKQKQLELLKTEFLSVTSHELRTPITPMKAQLQMILGEYFGKISDQEKKSLNMVLRNTIRLDHLIGDILDISKLQAGAMKFIPEEANLNTIAENCVETMKFKCDDKNIKLELVAEKIPLIVIDPDRITQVIINLINNAVKFTPASGKITVLVKNKKKEAEIQVVDTGIGIAKEDQRRIFSPFEQVDSSRNRHHEGTGLGLAISRGIVLYHGGDISVESKVGKGSAFKFTVPFKFSDGKGKKIELFHFDRDETVTNIRKKMNKHGYILKEEMADMLIEENLIRHDGKMKAHVSIKDLEEKGFVRKKK